MPGAIRFPVLQGLPAKKNIGVRRLAGRAPGKTVRHMLNLHFAPSLDLLVPELLSELRRVWEDPFAPPSVVVPSPALGKWLAMRLADGAVSARGDAAKPDPLGCVANLPTLMLERFLWGALAPDADMELLDASRLGHAVFALLDERLLGENSYAPLRDYLATRNGVGPDPLKRAQLSARIARRFLEYEFNRPSVWNPDRRAWQSHGIDASWLSGAYYAKDGGVHEEWQRDLYRRADALVSRAGPDGKRFLSLPRLHRLRRETGTGGIPWSVAPGHVFLFGVTKVSHFHRNLLVEISQMEGVTIGVYLTNPCAEFWEDVDTRRSRGVRRAWKSDSDATSAAIRSRRHEDYTKENLDFANLPKDHPLLELWGDAGKENIFLWCPQAQWNFEYHGPAWAESSEPPATLLRALQYSLLRGQSDLPRRNGALNADGSLVVLACPDRGREIEELREQILDLVHEGTIDRLNDVVAYLPDPAPYIPYIQKVFGAFGPGEPGFIPFTILSTPGGDGLFSQGMNILLDIAGGRFDRPAVFSLLANPLVLYSMGISRDDIVAWERWAEELGIFRGFNREHRAWMGDAGGAQSDAHTFELGIARMLAGNLADDPVNLDYRIFDNQGEAYAPVAPYRDFETGDRDRLEKFCETVETLHADCGGLKTAAGNGPGPAVAALTKMARRWFGALPDEGSVDAAEALLVKNFLDSLQSIPQGGDAPSPGRGYGLREFLAQARSCLPEELPGGAKAWTGGITFAPLRPAMIAPHRIVFAAGLDATEFPGTADRPGWDLLSKRRIVGDSDRVRDNRFAFLELVHAARERLVLSFLSRNMQKEEELQPSSVVLELETYLAGRAPAVNLRRDVPWILRESLDIVQGLGRKHGGWDPVHLELARIAAEGLGAADRYEASPLPPPRTALPSSPQTRTDLRGLRRFFMNPLEYHLSRTLGIADDDEPETADASDEPLESGALILSSLQKRIWTELLRKVFPPLRGDEASGPYALEEEARELAARAYDRHVASGRSPEAQFMDMERQSLAAWAVLCARATIDLGKNFSDHFLVVNANPSLGRAGVAGELRLFMPGGAQCMVACRHDLALVPRGGAEPGGCVGILGFKKDGRAADNPDLWMAGVLQWIAEQSQKNGPALRLVQLNRGSGDAPCFDCCAMKKTCDGGDIAGWLAARVDEMLSRRCDDHLPFASVKYLFGKGGWDAVTSDALAGELAGDHSVYRCRLDAFGLLDPAIPRVGDPALRALAAARFGPMLERWLHE
jgi:exonuclease V gamma subunit